MNTTKKYAGSRIQKLLEYTQKILNKQEESKQTVPSQATKDQVK